MEDIYHLMVDPAHQRQGIGKRLMKAVLRQVEQDSLPTYIVSSRESHDLYLQLGFRSLAYRRIDNEAWAKQVYSIEVEAGKPTNPELAAQYRGIAEDEHLMVKAASHQCTVMPSPGSPGQILLP
jgi:predicted N-acetyltransferase YhbS